MKIWDCKYKSKKYSDAQIMRIIAHSENMRTNAAHMYGIINMNQNNYNQVHWSCFFLLRIFSLSGVDNYRLFHVIESHSTNTYLWDIYVELRDNRSITMYTIVFILAPLSILNLISEGLTMIETQFPEVVIVRISRTSFKSSLKLTFSVGNLVR